MKLKVTTDKTGKVVKAVASVPPKQGDVPNLARTAVQWALTHWSGPPNTIGKTEVTFVMQ